MSPGKQQHGREAARRRAAQQAAREIARRRQRRMRVTVVGVVAIVVVLAIALAVVSGGGDDGDTATDAFDDSTSTTEIEDESTSSIPNEPTDAEFTYGSGECAPDEKPATRPETFEASPMDCLDEGVDYRAVIGTSEGTIAIDLLERRAPGTVNNFVQLAKWGWFDGDDFHRVVPGFVNQAGDPVGDPPGTGNPGYTIADELPSDVSEYVPGAVAMANSGPDTNGSQFFICVDCSILPSAGYSLFGQVTDGMDVVEAINALGTSDGPPSTPVTIVAVEILEDPLAEE